MCMSPFLLFFFCLSVIRFFFSHFSDAGGSEIITLAKLIFGVIMFGVSASDDQDVWRWTKDEMGQKKNFFSFFFF